MSIEQVIQRYRASEENRTVRSCRLCGSWQVDYRSDEITTVELNKLLSHLFTQHYAQCRARP